MIQSVGWSTNSILRLLDDSNISPWSVTQIDEHTIGIPMLLIFDCGMDISFVDRMTV